MILYRDRRNAGRAVGAALARYAGREDVVVLALPRGGVPVAYEVAAALNAPLDVFLVRKLGVPDSEELAMGALASGGVRVLNEDVLVSLGIPPQAVQEVVAAESRELERRERAYRGDRAPPNVRGKVAILVDDGLATGMSMRAAIDALRRLEPAHVVCAVPVGPASTCREMAAYADEVVCVRRPEPFDAVGLWYEDFSQTTDEEVRDLLGRAEREHSPPRGVRT